MIGGWQLLKLFAVKVIFGNAENGFPATNEYTTAMIADLILKLDILLCRGYYGF